MWSAAVRDIILSHLLCPLIACLSFFFFNDTATTEIYTLSLHDALPIFTDNGAVFLTFDESYAGTTNPIMMIVIDRKSTRLNSSHVSISYAVFCLKKKKKKKTHTI